MAVDTEALAKTISQWLKNGAAPGPSGWTGELIAPLVDDPECLDGLGALVADIINGDLDDHSRALIMSSLLIAGSKPNGGPPDRDIGILLQAGYDACYLAH